jgi:hypothetical protein
MYYIYRNFLSGSSAFPQAQYLLITPLTPAKYTTLFTKGIPYNDSPAYPLT